MDCHTGHRPTQNTQSLEEISSARFVFLGDPTVVWVRWLRSTVFFLSWTRQRLIVWWRIISGRSRVRSPNFCTRIFQASTLSSQKTKSLLTATSCSPKALTIKTNSLWERRKQDRNTTWLTKKSRLNRTLTLMCTLLGLARWNWSRLPRNSAP